MAKSFALAALVIAIIALFIPFVSVLLSLVACFFLIIAASFGEKVISIATVLIVLFNTFLFSPMNWVAMAGGGFAPIILICCMCAAVILLAILRTVIDGFQRPRRSTAPKIKISRRN